MQFLKYKKLTGRIKLLSGLHIGGNKDNIEIGGIDNPVIKHPITGLPYIPGSSIKGKMRFLLEWKLGRLDTDKGEPHTCPKPACPICRIFGNTHKGKKYGPTRLIVNDCRLALTEEQKQQLKTNDLVYLEDKVENRINRLTGTAEHPRHVERVPAGMVFDFGLTYKIFKIDPSDTDTDNVDEKNWDELVNALHYLQEDALGGSGSRGYGKIEFIDLKLDGKDVELTWNGAKAMLEETTTTSNN